MLKSFFKEGLEAGVDEAGRGCLAGPVCAAAVILPAQYHHPVLNDSKQLTAVQRDQLRSDIEANALSWAVAFCSHAEIDEMNILQATFTAMHRAIMNLSVKPHRLLIDGNRFRAFPQIPHHCFVKGDGMFASIAAASVLAKTHRDALMNNLDKEFPQYKWHKNKAYATDEHIKAIIKHGYSSYHRKSFHLKSLQPKLQFPD